MARKSGDAELAKLISSIAAVHSTTEYPLILGTTEQAQDLLQAIGAWGSQREKDIPNMVYDNMLGYFNKDIAGQIITGRAAESQDLTPVGVVTHPAPVDATSWLYWTPLVAEGIEESHKAVKDIFQPEVKDSFMNDISISNAMATGELIENYEGTPLGEYLFPKPKRFKVEYHKINANGETEPDGYMMESNETLPLSGWPLAYGEEGNVIANRIKRRTTDEFD